jgi:hypothetical protein
MAEHVGWLVIEHATRAVYADADKKAARILECGFALLDELERLDFILQYPESITRKETPLSQND